MDFFERDLIELLISYNDEKVEGALKGDSSLKTAGSVSQSDTNNNSDTTDEVKTVALDFRHA